MINNNAILLSIFFAFFITLYHSLHCYYVAKDPNYKGKLGIGWPWLHYNIVYLNKPIPFYKNYIIQSTITLFICSFFISFAAFNPIFIFKGFTYGEIFTAILALIAVCAFSQLIGAAAYKGWLSLLLTMLIGMLLYMRTENFNKELVTYAVTVLVGMTTGAITIWLLLMYKRKPKKSAFSMGLYSAVSPLLTWSVWLLLLFTIFGF